MHGTPPSPDLPDGPVRLPQDMDPMSVGQSIFGQVSGPESPEVEGFSEISYLARGGFSTVWRARRVADGVPVALKIPHQTNPEIAERLELEAAALQSLDHPHIVRLLEVTADTAGAPVLVMELVDGPPLTTQLPDKGFDFDHALQILLPVLDAIAHAHSRGIVHRDLKPSNILLAADGTPKVSDFGLAQSLHTQQIAFSLTRSGVLAGTVEYLAPERYEPGNESSSAADIFALGIILYELLTGRPPRGAWQPVAQIKRIDVRVDELILDAIRADPADRLPSATAFRQRLEEIRDSRPRYSGTPLVTRPVRYADTIWTVAGLYFLAAGFCSLLRINNTNVPGMFDLTFGHTKLLGGFWALWILTIGMGALWTWQAIRLWKFRKIPLREALPSPLGLLPGSSAGTALLVALTQLLCAWGPLAYIVWIYSQVWVWAAPETPVWDRVLAITRWGSEVPVSPWTWDPAGMLSGDEFWIRDMQPGLAPGTWRLHDRQSFFVVTQPLLMMLGGAGITLGVLATTAAAAVEWWRRRTLRLSLFLIAVCSAGVSLSRTVRQEKVSRQSEQNYTYRISFHYGELAAAAGRLINSIFKAMTSGGTELPPGTADAFASTLSIADGGKLDRATVIARLDEQRRQAILHRNFVENERSWLNSLGGNDYGLYEWAITWENYTGPSDAPARGTFSHLSCRGDVLPTRTGGFISAWEQTSTPLYLTDSRQFSTGEARAWLDSFLKCLSAEESPGLEEFFLPTLLAIEPSDARRDSPANREVTVHALRTSRAGWNVFTLTSASSPGLRPLPGARWELTCKISQTGTRRDGRLAPSEPLHWQFELVFTEGRWQILRLRI